MPQLEINDLGSIGAVKDVEGYMLPPEAWTTLDNVRVLDEGVERITGSAQVFGTPSVAPHFALPVANSSQTYVIYVSLTKAYVFDGASHTNITRQSLGVDVDYTASNTREWNGTLLGGVPILNNGIDVPQFWAAGLSTGTRLANLTNWPSTHRAKVLRAFGPYLVAFNVTKSGTQYPHLVLWSHPADPGSVPSSWDITDPTKDTGEVDLPDVGAGVILDALPLRGSMFVYKEGSTHKMSLIGGSFIFDFSSFAETSGILAQRCVVVTGDGTRHVVATQDDIVVHNGASPPQSILDKRYKKYLFNQLDLTNYVNSFMYSNPFKGEVGFCYPESGQTHPSRALVWNYKEGQFGALSERAVDFRNTIICTVESATDTVWSGASGSWGTYVGPWAQSDRRKVISLNTGATKFAAMDSGITNLGTAITGTAQRVAIAAMGRKRNGDPIVDYASRKVLRRLWIKASGGPINVRVGAQSIVDGPITWTTAKSFDPTSQRYIDVVCNGAAIGVEFSAAVPFRIVGYKLEGEVAGEH